MTTNYDLSKIRLLLIDGFSEAELRDFCFDTPEFRPVHHELADLTGRAAIVRQLLEFAERRELFDLLLAWAKANNPAKYAKYQSYTDPVTPSASGESPQTPPDRITLITPFPLELVRVPAGEFLMGSDPAKDKNARKDEQPQHRVYVSEFYIGRYPVTNEQYAVFVKAAKHPMPYHWKEARIPSGKENHPVVYVSWDDATAFCQWLNQTDGRSFRLPTEAEWEKAVRGVDERIYPWGNEWDKSKLNSKEGGLGDTTPVSSYSPGGDSPYGVADMAGNVWEWCADGYNTEEYQRCIQTVIKDPQGSKRGSSRVLRGGAFASVALWVRCAARVRSNWGYRIRNFGLRVVLGGLFSSETPNH